MKTIKLISSTLLFTCFLFSSCSSDEGTNNNSSAITPPNWIIGTWLQEEPIDTGLGVRFTSDDLILISQFNETSYKENIVAVEETGQSVDTENIVTNTNYKLTINYPGGSTLVFEFNKASDTQITWVSSPNALLNKQ